MAISPCTSKTSVSVASKGCAHRDAPLDARLSSGLTCTRLVPSLPFAKRTAPVSRYSASSSLPICCGFFCVFLYPFELVRAMTSRPGRFVSFPRNSSVMPSAK